MEVDFENRSPGPDDMSKVSIDLTRLADGDRWIELGEPLGGSQEHAPRSRLAGRRMGWNDRQDKFVSHIMTSRHGKAGAAGPVYALESDGRWALSPISPATTPGPATATPASQIRIGVLPRGRSLARSGEDRRDKLLLSFADGPRVPTGGDETAWACTGSITCSALPTANASPSCTAGAARPRARIRDPADHRRSRRQESPRCDPHGKTIRISSGATRRTFSPGRKHPSAGDGFYLYEDQTRKVEPVGRGT